MNYSTLSNIPEKELMPGFHGKIVHSDKMTLVYWRVVKDSEAPTHHHETIEQIVTVIEGQLELTVDGEAKVLSKGDIVIVPPMTNHSARAITDCQLLDMFSPVREDMK